MDCLVQKWRRNVKDKSDTVISTRLQGVAQTQMELLSEKIHNSLEGQGPVPVTLEKSELSLKSMVISNG